MISQLLVQDELIQVSLVISTNWGSVKRSVVGLDLKEKLTVGFGVQCSEGGGGEELICRKRKKIAS